MSAVVISLHKGQRMDITAQMKDADRVLELFQACDIRFDKKYTTITGEGPSTITFKGIRSKNTQDKIADLISELNVDAREQRIENVYIKFSTPRQKNNVIPNMPPIPEPAQTNETEDDTL